MSEGSKLTELTATTAATASDLVYLVDGTDSRKITFANFKSSVLLGTITTVDATYQILVTDETIICNKATAFTVTLPTAVVGQKFTIKNINTGVVTLEGDSSDTIDGDLNQSIYQWENMQVQCYVANSWSIL